MNERNSSPATDQRGFPKVLGLGYKREAGHQKTGNQPAKSYFLRQMNAIQGQPSPDGGTQV